MALGSVTVPPPQRWAKPFDPTMTPADVARVMALPPFDRIDPGRFPASTPLDGILRNDARLLSLERGDIVVRQGDYGGSAFFILSGQVRVVVDQGLPGSVLGRREGRRKGFRQALGQLWSNPRMPEVRDPRRYVESAAVGARRGSAEPDERMFLQDVPGTLDRHRTVLLGPGDLFGEISALGRTPRTATVFADGPAELLEVRWQGLRELRNRTDDLRENIDRLYRQRSLKSHLRATPLFAHLSDEDLERVAEQTLFETYGDYDWHTSYKRFMEGDAAERLEREPLIACEGHYVDGLIMVRAGFARVSVARDHGHHTLGYLGRGEVFGFEEVANNWRSDAESCTLQRSLRAIGYTDVLRVPTAVVERYVLADLPDGALPPPVCPRADAPQGAQEAPREAQGAGAIDQAMLEFLVEGRFINGTATLLIDMDRCTRCDDCVRACAAAHDNNPRFLRHGPIHDHYMVANACMHCSDPVCMIGCPTGAIHRDPDQGQVVINDITCIGCATCANSCPYNNIRMVHVNDPQGTQILNQGTFAPILKATKCDLCVDQMAGLGPACARACPHDALLRADMREPQTLAAWLNR
jgi:Fe-S-cluster-containing dehydrogenase component/CRP-like cAMP-binding protein